jgi:hypothetical protein
LFAFATRWPPTSSILSSLSSPTGRFACIIMRISPEANWRRLGCHLLCATPGLRSSRICEERVSPSHCLSFANRECVEVIEKLSIEASRYVTSLIDLKRASSGRLEGAVRASRDALARPCRRLFGWVEKPTASS